MSFAIVTVEIVSGEKKEMALPLDVPSRTVAANVMREFGGAARPGEKYALYIQTGRGDKPIPPAATLGELGIKDGQRLRVKRETGAPAAAQRADAYLRTVSGDLIPLRGSNIIIGRKDPTQQIPLDLDLTRYDPSQALSRRHACIGRDAANYYLIDLQSTNGTQLNGENIIPERKMPLQDGDQIEFGLGMRVTFVTGNSGAGN